MSIAFTRRSLIAAGAMLLAAGISTAAVAQDKPTLRFSAVFSEQDIRARMMEKFAEAVADDFTIEVFHGGTLFSQGTELVALQRSRDGSRPRISPTSSPPGRSSRPPTCFATPTTSRRSSKAKPAKR